MKKVILWFKKHKPSKRKLIQLYAALLFNANLKGFATGRIYQGDTKNACLPGLNCYSCPGAVGACPLGSLQNSLYVSGKSMFYYVFGIIVLFGFLFGRWICGFLCPFGLIQELLHKIPTPKIKKGRITRVLSYFKYVVLAVFVFVVPLMFASPAFCKYICPSGTLEGAIGLLSNPINEGMFSMLGWLFTWKFLLLVLFVLGCVFMYRFFCRFFCPLGALYGLFNKISLVGVKVDQPKCTDCGICVNKCQMDIRKVGDQECISCGECISVCPTKAIQWKGGKWTLPENEIPDASHMTMEEKAAAEADLAAKNARIAKRNKVVKVAAGVAMAAVLIGALVYYNGEHVASLFSEKETEMTTPTETQDPDVTLAERETLPEPEPEVGVEVGNICYPMDVPLFGDDGALGENVFNASKLSGDKVTVLNFWFTTCVPCKEELPDFDRVATEYKDKVDVIALHSNTVRLNAVTDWIVANYPDSDMKFGHDAGDAFYNQLFANVGTYPTTVILDEKGVIIAKFVRKVHYDELKSIIDGILAE